MAKTFARSLQKNNGVGTLIRITSGILMVLRTPLVRGSLLEITLRSGLLLGCCWKIWTLGIVFVLTKRPNEKWWKEGSTFGDFG